MTLTAETLTADSQTYEALQARLQVIVDRLEHADQYNEALSVEELMRLYEEGANIVQACQQILDAAELRVQYISPLSGEDTEQMAVAL